jgi:hypothetical protein
MSLPDIDNIRSGDRHEAEFWIGYADGEMKCLHPGEHAGYDQSIKEEEYMTAKAGDSQSKTLVMERPWSWKDINHF